MTRTLVNTHTEGRRRGHSEDGHRHAKDRRYPDASLRPFEGTNMTDTWISNSQPPEL